MDKLAVVIINYKTPDMTIRCAETVLAAMPIGMGRVIIVENGSQDASPEQLGAWRSQHERAEEVDLVISERNTGFSGGNNLGIAAANAEYVLLQNSDAFVTEDALTNLIAAADQDTGAGLIHPTLTDPDGTPQISKFRSFTPLTELVNASNLSAVARFFGGHVTAIELDSDDTPDWVSFASIMLRQKMIDDIGLMDEGFFLYYEDAEFCERARRNGWQIKHVPDAKVIHERGGSSPVKKLTAARKRLPAYFYESRARYYKLNYGKPGLISANLLWYVGRALGFVKVAALKSPPKVCDHAGQDIWLGFNSSMTP